MLNFLIKLFRSSRPEVFCEKGVLKNFAEFTGKHLCQSLYFNNVGGLRPATFLKKRLWHRCFSVNFAKLLKTPFFTEHLWWLLLVVDSFYIDDFTGGADNFVKPLELFKKLKLGFLEGSFNLRKWKTNHSKLPELISKIKESLEHVYMRPEVNSNRFEISNCFEKSFRLHGDFTATTCK